ncbi:MAG: serine hydrolase domain-containing protein, partial [Bacteroidota bacterium]
MNRTILALFLCLIITACQSPEQTESDKFTLLSKLVDQYASHTLEKGNIHSLAVAVYLDGQVYQNYYGSIDQGQNNPPDDQSLFEIASISKVFVGSLAAKAVLEKKISLEDDIRLYLDGKYENLQFGDRPITIKHLLTHTLGFDTPEKIAAIYQEIFNGSDSGKSIDYDMEDLLEELRSVEVAREPGTAYDYSNVGPEILAYILQSVYQKPYEELLMAFFAERGMNHSFLGNKDMPGLVNGYDENGQRANLDQNPLLGGAGGIFMSLPDLATFMQFQLESQDPLIVIFQFVISLCNRFRSFK